jgi:acyl carrier protein phosphodiesterase
MNFLAHIFLSGEDRDLVIGNFIADYVKGIKIDSYPETIRKGILLHRAIDSFTDFHPITSISKQRLYQKHHKYSGPVVDIFYDHFLAKNFSEFSKTPLEDFTKQTYQIITSYSEILPEKVLLFLPFMIERNWLLNYSTVEGIGRTLTGIGKRVSFSNNMHTAWEDLVQNYDLFEDEFFQFFPELITFANSKRQ